VRFTRHRKGPSTPRPRPIQTRRSLLGHEQQHAILDALAAELRVVDAHAVSTGFGLGPSHEQHGDLAALAALRLGQGLLERAPLV